MAGAAKEKRARKAMGRAAGKAGAAVSAAGGEQAPRKAGASKAVRRKQAGRKRAAAGQTGKGKAVRKDAGRARAGAAQTAQGRTLGELRARLDEIDRRILESLADRQASVRQVAALKAGDNTGLRDILREEEQLTRLVELGRERGLDAYHVARIFRQVLEHSLRYQQEFLADRRSPERRSLESVTVAYQGAEGAYSHIAAMKHFGPREVEAVFRPCESFQSMLEAVKSGGAHYGVLPIENTTAGSINEAYDLLARMNLPVVGEEILSIDHCLVAFEDVHLNRVRRIYSHPQALAQCSNFLSGLRHCTVESFLDTAMAVKKIRGEQDPSQAAIASEEAANLYGLAVIKRDIANQRDNYTRFVVVAPEPVEYDLRIPCKTSLIFATRHEKGALLKCLNVLSGRGLNLTKLESRPRPNVVWEYLFYLDFEGNLADPAVKAAIAELMTYTSYLKVLGSYPARTTREARPAAPRRPVKGRRTGEARESPAGQPERPEQGPQGSRRAPRRPAEDKRYRLASRTHRAKDTTVSVGGVLIGGRRPVVAAGPPYLESPEQIASCARAARNLGADLLYGGCFRTGGAEQGFQGLGFKGLGLLEQAGRNVGLPVMTEVGDPAEVARVARQADLILVGGSDMANAALLRAVGQVDCPVLLGRGSMASIDEWLAAAEQILATGNQQVILCESGVRILGADTRRTLDLTAVPQVRELTHLPLLVAPSRAVPSRRFVAPLAEASLACGAQGLLVEIHPEPDQALLCGERALGLEDFEGLMQRLASLLG